VAGLRGRLQARLAAEAAVAWVVAGLVGLLAFLLLGWGLVAGLVWLVRDGGSLTPVDVLLPGLVGLLLVAGLIAGLLQRFLIARQQRQTTRAAYSALAAQLLVRMPLLLDLQPDERARLLTHAAFERVRAGSLVVRQGARADRFYLTLEGSADVRQRQPAASEQLVARLGLGDYFGELALLHGGRRAASVAAREALVLLSVDQAVFNTIVAPRFQARAAADRAVRGRAVLTQSALFQQLTPAEVDWLLTRLQTVSVHLSETIIRQGDPGDRFYLVVSGAVQVHSAQPGGSVVVARLGPGDHFGELALFFDTPRTATVVAEAETELLVLSREDFRQLFSSDIHQTQPLSAAGQACYRLATERLGQLAGLR